MRRLSLAPAEPEPKMSVAYRRDARYAVWDERGLTIRDGKKIRSTFLDEIAVSPKAQTREQILDTVALVKKGARTKRAAALSGSRRIGNAAFFVPRWVDSKGQTWLETLVRVDLDKPNPKPQLLLAYKGRSTATRPLDDRLLLFKGKLAMVTSSVGKWGLTTYDPGTSKDEFQELGADLRQYLPGGLFVEKTNYGTFVAGRVDLESGKRSILAESRDELRLLDETSPLMAIETSSTGITVRNLDSGALANVPLGSQVGRLGNMVAIWSPKTKPTRAAVYNPERWTAVARLGAK
ncbi:hypothetical protein EON79_02200 [bacterium]|nr:MAG: hypothetical protein EON79_02200 [bacterium]